MTKKKSEVHEKAVPVDDAKYDPVIIAKQLLEWVKKEDSINLCAFCADNSYMPGQIWRLEKESAVFYEAYMIAKMRLAERRERLMNAEKLNYGSFARYQPFYDPFLNKDEEIEKEKDAKRKHGIVQTGQLNFVALAKMALAGEIRQKD